MSIVGHKYGNVVMGAVVLLVIGSACQAYADPVHITSGNINFLNFDGASMILSGPNAAELGGEMGGTSGTGYRPPYACFSSTGGCAGQTANLSMSDSLTSTPGPSGLLIAAGMIVNGTLYGIDSFSYAITAGDVIVPLNGRVTTPFTFAATAVGTSALGVTATFDWTGGGDATASYEPGGWFESDYTFSPQSVTPEPASVLLLATGVAGVFFGRRRLLQF